MADNSSSGIMGALGPIGAGLGVVSSLMKLFTGGEKRASKAIHPVNDQYNVNPIAQGNYGMAQQRYNSPDVNPALRNQLFANNANFQQNAERNSGDAGTNLALAAAGQGQTDQSLTNAQIQGEARKDNLAGDVYNTGNALVREGQYVHEDRIRTYNDDMKRKNDLMNAYRQNQYNGVQDLGQTAMLAGQGAFGQFGKGGGGGSGMSYSTGGPGLMGNGSIINPSLYSTVSGYSGMSPFAGNYVSR